jgi:glutathione S-transferase
MTQPLKASLRQQTPNNMKVQIALALKGIDYEVEAITDSGPATTTRLVEASGQPLAPFIQHGDVRLFDSSAILRYFDANLPGPRLFSSDRTAIKEIEAWELYTKTVPMPAIAPAFKVYFGGLQGDEADQLIQQANEQFHAATEKVELALAARAEAGSDWLVGDSMTAADILVATYMVFGAFPPGKQDWHPLWIWFHANVSLGPDRERTAAHVARVLEYLPPPA